MAELRTINETGRRRVVVTRELPGDAWLGPLVQAGCRVDIRTDSGAPDRLQLEEMIGARCDGAVGQLTEAWDEALLSELASAGGCVYSNCAVGHNNVDVPAASRLGIAVGNTPGVLTQATAEFAVALTLAAARRVVEADAYVRSGQFLGWEPDLMLGGELRGATLGVIGAGRIGAAYATAMMRAFGMHVIYWSRTRNVRLEEMAGGFSAYAAGIGEPPVTCRRVHALDELLTEADVVSLHVPLTRETHHLIDRGGLSRMRSSAILINTSRGPVVDEVALVEHCRESPEFRVGLDVFEEEPAMQPGLAGLPNVVLAPHIGSASSRARRAMAQLAALNVAAVLNHWPVWSASDMWVFIGDTPPRAAPSIVNAHDIGLRVFE